MALQQNTRTVRGVLQGLAGIGLMLGLWWLLTVPFSAPGSMGQRFAPGPSLLTLVSLLQGGEIWLHIAVSLQRVAVGLGLALLVGVPLGLLLGASAGDWVGDFKRHRDSGCVGARVDRHSLGDWYCVDCAGSLRDAGRICWVGLFYFGYARSFGLSRADGNGGFDWSVRLFVGYRVQKVIRGLEQKPLNKED